MTKPEFQDLQKRASASGMTLKSFLQDEGVAYSTYNYLCRKMKAETETQPMAPISIFREPHGGIRNRHDAVISKFNFRHY